MKLKWEYTESYQALGEIAPDLLTPTRLQAHWASQILESAARSLAAPEPGDTHTAMLYDPSHQRFTSREAARGDGLRVGIEFNRSMLVILDRQGQAVLHEHSLDAQNLETLYGWVSNHLSSEPLALPDYDMPSHPVAEGAPFALDPRSTGELMRWFANGHVLLQGLVSQQPAASPIRTWPHHFDMATLILLDTAGDPAGESSPSINVGLSPGDANYDEPYLYVSGWPYPDGYDRPNAALPELDGSGQWHTEGFLAAILPGSRLVAMDGARAQFDAATGFLERAIEASRSMVEGGL